MAIQKSVETADGYVAESGYFVPFHLHMDVASLSGTITFGAFLSKSARVAKKAPLSGITKQYQFTPEQFIAAQKMKMSELLGAGVVNDDTTIYQVLATFMYRHAKTALTEPFLDDEGKPVLDEDEKPVLRSFFEGAKDVF